MGNVPARRKDKSPVLAAGMSFFVPGTGSLYAGGAKAGSFILGVFMLIVFLTWTGLAEVPFAAWLAVWLGGMGHASAQAYLTSHRELD